MKQVEIPNDYFFKMACKDYYDWQRALIREFIQNSVDAGASVIMFYHEGDYLTVVDDGCGMDMNVINHALLTLGGSAKKDSSSIGGLGKAKEILYFSWPEWEIKTNTIQINGQGCRYEINITTPHVGVTSRIKIEDRIPNVENIIKSYVDLCCLKGTTVYFNDVAINTSDVQYGKKVFTIEGLGDLFENLAGNCNQVTVQAHGLFMFSNYSVLDKGYVFNITMPSYECLTANRDGFIGVWNDRFNQMIGKVAIDTESSHLRKEQIIYVRDLKCHSTLSLSVEETMEGVKATPLGIAISGISNKPVDMITIDDLQEFIDSGYVMTENLIDETTGKKLRTLVKKARTSKLFDACLKWYRDQFQEGFIIVSEEDITRSLIADLYGRETLQMTILWKEIVDSLAEMQGIEKNYGYGIVIAEKTAARCQDGFILYNPRVFEPYDWGEAAVKMLIAATEELVHFCGYSYHNETFKCQFSNVLEKALHDRVFVDDFLSPIRKVRKSL